jgi:hypothetical protein
VISVGVRSAPEAWQYWGALHLSPIRGWPLKHQGHPEGSAFVRLSALCPFDLLTTLKATRLVVSRCIIRRCLTRIAQQFIHSPNRLTLHVREHVAVDVERDRTGAVWCGCRRSDPVAAHACAPIAAARAVRPAGTAWSNTRRRPRSRDWECSRNCKWRSAQRYRR